MPLSTFVHLWKDKSSTRTLLLLHGTGGTENDLITLAEMIDPDANLLSLRGNSRDEGVNRFFRRKAEGVLDEDDIRLRTAELSEFLHVAVITYSLKPEETIALGYSNGANIAAALLLLNPEALKGAILIRPMAPFQAQIEGSPIGAVLVLSGQRDSIVPVQQTQLLVDQLTHRGAVLTWQRQPAGHEVIRADLAAIQSWLGEEVGWQ